MSDWLTTNTNELDIERHYSLTYLHAHIKCRDGKFHSITANWAIFEWRKKRTPHTALILLFQKESLFIQQYFWMCLIFDIIFILIVLLARSSKGEKSVIKIGTYKIDQNWIDWLNDRYQHAIDLWTLNVLVENPFRGFHVMRLSCFSMSWLYSLQKPWISYCLNFAIVAQELDTLTNQSCRPNDEMNWMMMMQLMMMTMKSGQHESRRTVWSSLLVCRVVYCPHIYRTSNHFAWLCHHHALVVLRQMHHSHHFLFKRYFVARKVNQ